MLWSPGTASTELNRSGWPNNQLGSPTAKKSPWISLLTREDWQLEGM